MFALIAKCILSALLTVAMLASLTGCVVMPDSTYVEVDHTSHASQHWPFTDHPTNYGFETIAITGKWNVGKRVSLEVSEGYTVECLDNRHEVFQARASYQLPFGKNTEDK